MSSAYISIPVAVKNRDGLLLDIIASLNKIESSLRCTAWKPGFTYEASLLLSSDVFIFVHQENRFKFNLQSLPCGVLREYFKAKELDKKIFLAYKTVSDGIKFYDIDETNDIVSGIVGSTSSLYNYLETKTTHESVNPCAEIPLPEHSIELRKNVSNTSYDRRLLL